MATEYGTTWWGHKWLDALSGIDFANRIPRGKTYANTGKVFALNLDLGQGLIKARVSGHYDPFYAVKIKVPRVDHKKAQEFIEKIASSPKILAALSNRELDPKVNDIANELGINVFPNRWNDLSPSCSCPDVAVPCKHIAAVIYKLSQEIDANPFILFSLKGIDIFAGLKEYGIELEQTQESEIPTWKELISKEEYLPPLPLESLNHLSFSSFKPLQNSILGLFSSTPPGYTEGSLKEVLNKVLTQASKTATKRLSDKQDRDLPVIERETFLKVNAWGKLQVEKVSWTIHPTGADPILQYPKDLPDDGYISAMFSGAIDPKSLEDASSEIEALYQIWLIATKLMIAGDVIPQIYEPIADCFSIRWIPAIIDKEINEVTSKVGQALLSCKPQFIEIERAPEQISAKVLGQIALSLFINSYIKEAYHKLTSKVEDQNPERSALFLINTIDTEDYLNGESIKMRLDTWLSPIYLEHLDLKPIIILQDKSQGTLEDFVKEKRTVQYCSQDDAFYEAFAETFDDEDYDLVNASEDGSLKPILGGKINLRSQNLKETKKAIADSLEKILSLRYQAQKLGISDEEILNLFPKVDEDELKALESIKHKIPNALQKAPTEQTKTSSQEPVEELSENEQLELLAQKIRAENSYVALDEDENLQADTNRSLFSNEQGIEIAMGFKENDKESATFVSLSDIVNKKQYAQIRFECLRTVSRLSQICPPLSDLLENHKGQGIIALENLAGIISNAIPALKLLGVELIIPRALRKILTPSSSMSLDLEDLGERNTFLQLTDLLQFDWQLAIGNKRISQSEFDELKAKVGQIVRFRNEFVYVDPNEINRIAKKLETINSKTLPSKQRLMAAALTGKFGVDNVILSQKLKEALDELLSEKALSVPKTLKATLRPYQERGFSWLMRNIKTSMGSIIADDMGLGKTLQVIAALEKMRSDGALDEKSALIVVPTSLLVNWQREMQKFAPKLTFKQIYGNHKNFEPHTHVILTTYGVVRSQLNTFKKKNFALMIIDEAQAIKTHTSQIFKAVRQIKADSFIAMSGTPVENRLLEYWSIMDFVNPGLLGTADNFKKEFANPIERNHDLDAITRFKNVTSPFIMRRLKTDKAVISDLPDKLTYDRYCSLSKEQTALYNEVVEATMKTLHALGNGIQRSGLILQLITNLKILCNAPELYAKNCPYHGAEYSGKAQMLFEILDSIFDARRKVLIFTQFRQTGELLQNWISNRYNFKPDFLSGEVAMKARSKMVDKFQNDRKQKAFILSLKAAGTGLNLTQASAVIHFDLWWNPAAESQATDRAYRIGQKQNVEVFRLICANTFEEKINAMIEEKKALADLTVNSGESWIGDLSNRQLDEIFKLSENQED